MNAVRAKANSPKGEDAKPPVYGEFPRTAGLPAHRSAVMVGRGGCPFLLKKSSPIERPRDSDGR